MLPSYTLSGAAFVSFIEDAIVATNCRIILREFPTVWIPFSPSLHPSLLVCERVRFLCPADGCSAISRSTPLCARYYSHTDCKGRKSKSMANLYYIKKVFGNADLRFVSLCLSSRYTKLPDCGCSVPLSNDTPEVVHHWQSCWRFIFTIQCISFLSYNAWLTKHRSEGKEVEHFMSSSLEVNWNWSPLCRLRHAFLVIRTEFAAVSEVYKATKQKILHGEKTKLCCEQNVCLVISLW